MEEHGPLVPGRFDPRFARVFTWYTRRLVGRRFHGLRILRKDLGVLDALESHAAPAIVLLNHPSWWDPLVAVLLATRCTPTRTPCAPMDLAQLRRFGFFRRLGLFGIDPEDPGSAAHLAAYVREQFESRPRTTLWITPQGRFTDVRRPIELRAGSAMIAAATPDVAVVAVAIEYVFWQDQRPEILLAAERVVPASETGAGGRSAGPEGPGESEEIISAPSSLTGLAEPNPAEPIQAPQSGSSARRAIPVWHRAMTRAMTRATSRLAAAAMARDPAPFATLLGDEGARINPIYDLWLRLRGRGGAIPTTSAEPRPAARGDVQSERPADRRQRAF